MDLFLVLLNKEAYKTLSHSLIGDTQVLLNKEVYKTLSHSPIGDTHFYLRIIAM